MKRVRLSVLFIFAFCTLVFNSCKNQITDFNTISYLNVNVDGVPESTFTTAALNTTGKIQVISKLTGTEILSISITNPKVGTFDVLNDGVIFTYAVDSNNNNSYVGLTGTVTITAYNSNSIAGTFQFVGTNAQTSTTKILSEGLFKCSF